MSTDFPTSLDDFPNPVEGAPIKGPSVITPLKHFNLHGNINDAVEALEAKVGINFSAVSTSFDYIINSILLIQNQHASGVKRIITGQPFPTSVIWYADSGATIKLVEKIYTYNGSNLITQIVLKLYNGTIANTLKRTITDSITLSGPFETSRSRIVS